MAKKFIVSLTLGTIIIGTIIPLLVEAEQKFIETCHVTQPEVFKVKGVEYKDYNGNTAIPIDCNKDGTSDKYCYLNKNTGKVESSGSCTIDGTQVPACKLVPYTGYGVCCIMNAIATATDWIFAIVLSIAIIFIIWGAFSLITAGGSSEKAVKGRNYIVYAVVGFVVALLAKAIPAIAAWFLGG